MREIKFRLIRDGKIVGYEKHSHSGTVGIGVYHSRVNDDCEDFEWVNVRFYKTAWIEHDTKEQFIGHLDSNGHDIYEGDIIEWDRVTGFDDGTGVVIWNSNQAGFFVENDATDVYDEIYNFTPTSHSVRVIGNIHQNPELLEAPNA